jgi:hypothetical protein
VKSREWKRISPPLADLLPGFEPVRAGFVRRHPWIAECLLYESSDFSRERFYLQAFALPLFIPTNHLYFTYGFRVGNGYWEAVDANLLEEVRRALPKLERLATLEGLRTASADWHRNLDPYHAEVQLCLHALFDDRSEFQDIAERLDSWKTSTDWASEVLQRCKDFAAIVLRGGSPAGIAELQRRRDSLDFASLFR